jgi:hypothetical protein
MPSRWRCAPMPCSRMLSWVDATLLAQHHLKAVAGQHAQASARPVHPQRNGGNGQQPVAARVQPAGLDIQHHPAAPRPPAGRPRVHQLTARNPAAGAAAATGHAERLFQDAPVNVVQARHHRPGWGCAASVASSSCTRRRSICKNSNRRSMPGIRGGATPRRGAHASSRSRVPVAVTPWASAYRRAASTKIAVPCSLRSTVSRPSTW